MEFEEIIKIIWFAIILVIFVASRFMSNKRVNNQSPVPQEFEDQFGRDFEEEGSTIPIEFEQLFRKEKPVAPKVKSTPKPQPIASNLEEATPVNNKSQGVEFDLRKAIIMTEILTPKFKNE